MDAGEVVVWEQFSLHRLPGEDKDRWFVYLGDTGSFCCPQILFMITPTTQTADFEKGGARHGRKVVRFEPNPASPFARTCLIDVENDFFDLPSECITACSDKIKLQGKLSSAKILEIWRIIESSKKFSKVVIKDIRRCLSNAGYL